MDIKDFNYRETPIKKTRVYEVHTLNQDGLNQYLDKNSYVHKFLKSLSPNRSKSINFNHNDFCSSDISSKALQQDCLSDKNLKESKDFNSKRNEKGGVITINANNFHKNIYYKPINDSYKNEKAEKTQKIKNENHHEDNYFNSLNEDQNLNLAMHPTEIPISNSINNEKKCSEYNQNLENNYANFENNNKKSTFLQTSKHMFSNQNRFSQIKNQNSLRQKGYLSPKYSEDYNFAISNLKEDFYKNLINNSNIASKNSFSKNKFPNGNFKSYEVPHLEYKRHSNNFRINLIRDKLENTLLKSGKNTNVNSNSNEDLEIINKNIEGENLKLKNYFENINKFVKNDKKKLYPSVNDITNCVNLRTTKLKLLNNKFMGERYDPTNYA